MLILALVAMPALPLLVLRSGSGTASVRAAAPQPSRVPLVVTPGVLDAALALVRPPPIEEPAPPDPWLELLAWDDERDELIARLVADLRDDAVRRNAWHAEEQLRGLGLRAVPALRRALSSPDVQQRQLAAWVLAATDPAPTQRHLLVLLEILREESVPWLTLRLANWLRYDRLVRDSVMCLADHALRIEPQLLARLDSDDYRERYMCAFLLGWSGSTANVARVATVLLPHLADNDVTGDALMSSAALLRIGTPVVPHLRAAARVSFDGQAAELLAFVDLDIADPPRSAAEARAVSQDISRRQLDPVVQFRWQNVEAVSHDWWRLPKGALPP